MTRCSAGPAAACSGAAWQHDGSSPAKSKLSYGNCFVTAGIVVALPFCSRPVCLPVLARLHVPGRGRAVKPRMQGEPTSAVSCAVTLVRLLAGPVRFPAARFTWWPTRTITARP
jgi:hypothetical protein